MLPPFSLPSKPEIRITLREATVAEVIDFAGVNVGQEEEVTTLFLNTVQEKASFVDSRIWTAEDRRFGLLWYFMNTPGDKDMALSYECQHCGKTHDFLQDCRKLNDTYKPLKGAPEREFQWEGEKVTVRPVDGHGMEELEGMKLVLDSIGDENSGEYQKQAARMRLVRFELCVFFDDSGNWVDKVVDKFKSKSKKEEEAQAKAKLTAIRVAKRKRLTSMPYGKFEEFAGLVMEKLSEMEHGLESVYQDGRVFLITPPHQCPNKKDVKEATTRIRVTFRNSDYIPRIQ